ncbi:lactosylceramide 4-alpha-galactosyltransferase-like [Penaeus chinensis]|uniref:lactosylceramide 4-alpha-galactosyltransferase-like n=1 Tax=Penaeus chinensis TaxID=139456 RepID=UPI001FB79F3A|nr:lactosylceramide 4-alpha-galactosyltransferase-like [Penaeus chinensis]
MAIFRDRIRGYRCHRLIAAVVISCMVISVFLLVPLTSLDSKSSDVRQVKYGHRFTYKTWLDHLCPRSQIRDAQAQQLRLKWEAPSVKTIFFMQTSCADALTAREACAVESFAQHHPDRPILLLMTSFTMNHTNPIMQTLLQLPNFRAAYLDLDVVFSEEPLRTWHTDRNWLIVERKAGMMLSDASRSEILRRFGGTYTDLDAIALRPLPNGTNWLAEFYDGRVTAALSSFLPGHNLFQRVVDAIPRAFNPYACCSIGPDLVTAEMRHLCPDAFSSIVANDLQESAMCSDITVLPIGNFYPINYEMGPRGFSQLLRSGTGQEFLKSTKAHSLHLFSSLTAKDLLYLGGGSILEEVAKKYCPKVFKAQRSISAVM